MLDDVASFAPDHPAAAPTTTLADVRPGDTAQVRAVSPHVRDALAGLGLHEGAYVRCESVDRYVVVRTADGTVPLERGLVSAVEITALTPAADLRTGEWWPHDAPPPDTRR